MSAAADAMAAGAAVAATPHETERRRAGEAESGHASLNGELHAGVMQTVAFDTDAPVAPAKPSKESVVGKPPK